MGGFELWMWLFMRISGIVLLVLALGHTLIMHLPAGGVDRVDFGFVAARWASPFWRTWDWMMLTLALIHGINGLRNITLDYVRKPGVRFAMNMFFYVLGFTLFILGTVIVVTFDPADWRRWPEMATDARRTGIAMATTHTLRRPRDRRRRRRHARRDRAQRSGAHRGDLEALPHPLAHRRGAGRRLRGARATPRRTPPSGTPSTP